MKLPSVYANKIDKVIKNNTGNVQKNAGTHTITAYYEGKVPVLGLPGCVMYAKRTIFDLVLPRIAAGEKLKKEDLDRLGEGGLCLSCERCTFPNCGFGK